jgi:hypothetical protein
MALEKTLNPGTPDNWYATVIAAEGATIPANAVVQLDLTVNSDGARVVQPNANELWAAYGITVRAIADGDTGIIQTKGFKVAPVNQAAGAQAPGLPLVATAGQYYLTADVLAPANQNNQVGVLMETIGAGTPGTTTLAKVWLFGR